jgi:hypothetical protein
VNPHQQKWRYRMRQATAAANGKLGLDGYTDRDRLDAGDFHVRAAGCQLSALATSEKTSLPRQKMFDKRRHLGHDSIQKALALLRGGEVRMTDDAAFADFVKLIDEEDRPAD